MPGFDQRGPAGQGPMTGRRMVPDLPLPLIIRKKTNQNSFWAGVLAQVGEEE
jgi:hypothetical protein